MEIFSVLNAIQLRCNTLEALIVSDSQIGSRCSGLTVEEVPRYVVCRTSVEDCSLLVALWGIEVYLSRCSIWFQLEMSTAKQVYAITAPHPAMPSSALYSATLPRFPG